MCALRFLQKVATVGWSKSTPMFYRDKVLRTQTRYRECECEWRWRHVWEKKQQRGMVMEAVDPLRLEVEVVEEFQRRRGNCSFFHGVGVAVRRHLDLVRWGHCGCWGWRCSGPQHVFFRGGAATRKTRKKQMLPLKIASSGGKWWPEELDKGVAGRVHGSSVDYTMVTRYILWLEIMVYWEPLNMWFTVAFAYRSHKFVKPSAFI